MAHDDLRDFIRALEKNNELKRIPFEVDTPNRIRNLMSMEFARIGSGYVLNYFSL